MSNITSATEARAGMLESAFQKLFTRKALVEDVEEVGASFRIVTLTGDELQGVEWVPGDKVQILFGGWVQRTYTPMHWDAKAGRTSILIYLHGDAPGTLWARALKKGDSCVVLGPRKSIRLSQQSSPVILFGDETSIGVAAAFSNHAQSRTVLSVFEVTSLKDSTHAFEQLLQSSVAVHAREEGSTHLYNLEAEVVESLMAHPGADLVLTGKATSIQALIRQPLLRGVSSKKRHQKAYWALGKTGLD